MKEASPDRLRGRFCIRGSGVDRNAGSGVILRSEAAATSGQPSSASFDATGAVVGQQPFGGARGSGMNDKAGCILNLVRWISPRTIKETFAPARSYEYPFLAEK
jgi:hypothetical protein